MTAITLRSLGRTLALVAGLAACAEPGPLRPAEGPAPVRVAAGTATPPADPAAIVAAEVLGDRLRVQVRFGGGCREHAFSLYRDDGFLESDPVQLRLRLSHDAGGDACRALLMRDLEFDLSPIRDAYRAQYGGGGAVVLHLHAPGDEQPSPSPLVYRF